MKQLHKQPSLTHQIPTHSPTYSTKAAKPRSLPRSAAAYLLREQRLLFVLLGALIASTLFLLHPYFSSSSPLLLPSPSHPVPLFPNPVDRASISTSSAVMPGRRVPVGLRKPSQRIVVTGGAGFVGSHLVDKLLARGDSVIVIDNFFTGRKENVVHHFGNPRFELIRHDVVEPILLEVDQIYHLACPASPVHYKYNPIKTIKTNVMGTLNMLGLAKRIGARFLLTSTSEVYGDPLEHPQKETYWGNVNPIGVRSCYDEGKRTAETLTMDYHRGGLRASPAMTIPRLGAAAVFALLISIASAEVFFEERFEDGWESRWVKSDWKKEDNMAGEWNHTSGKWNGDANDKGIQTTEDYRFYAISAGFPGFSNKDKTLVFQFSVKHEQKLDCGGGYMKLLSGDVDQKTFSGETPYSIMFGPDICGYSTKKVHAILTRNGKNHLIKKDVPCETDQLTHVYTFIIRPDATYSILVDNTEKQTGSIYSEWDILPPKQIKDPEAKKPEDWDDKEFIPDPEDTKPEGYDDIPKEITDVDAKKPEDWDDEEDGEWTAPTIPNPDYKGPWTQKKIKNPNYKGKWKAPMIDNPDFKDDPYIYAFDNLKYVGIELWQVKSGTLFDNVLVSDDPEYAKKLAEETWGKQKDAEKAAFDEFEKSKIDEESKDDDADLDDEDGFDDAEAAEEDSDLEKEDDAHDEL